MMDGHLFNSIALTGHGDKIPGRLEIYPRGIWWEKQGGGKAVQVDKSDLAGVTWLKGPRTIPKQLGVFTKDGSYYKFTGFLDKDLSTLTNFFQISYGVTLEEKEFYLGGSNRGEVDLRGNSLTFSVGSKQAFGICLDEVSRTRVEGKKDVILEFGDSSAKDSLVEMVFEVENPSQQPLLHDRIKQVTKDRVEVPDVVENHIAMVNPRGGLYSVELYQHFLRFQEQHNGEFEILCRRIDGLLRLTVLNQREIYVVLLMKPPARIGGATFGNIVMRGVISEDFTTRLGRQSCNDVTTAGDGLNAILGSDGGVLFLLKELLLFMPCTTLVRFSEIEEVEIQKGTSFFNLLVRLKTGQKHLFRDVPLFEYQKVYGIISEKMLKLSIKSQSRAAAGRDVQSHGGGGVIECVYGLRRGMLLRLAESMVICHTCRDRLYTTIRFEEIQWVRFRRGLDQSLTVRVKLHEETDPRVISSIEVRWLEELFTFFKFKKHVRVKRLPQDLKEEREHQHQQLGLT